MSGFSGADGDCCFAAPCTMHQAPSYLPIQSTTHYALPATRYDLPRFAFVMIRRRKAGQANGRHTDKALTERMLLIISTARSLAHT